MLWNIEGNVSAIIETVDLWRKIMWPKEPVMPEIKEAWIVDKNGQKVTEVTDRKGQQQALKALNRLMEAIE